MKAFDMHCDTLLGGNRNHWDLVNDQMHISLDKLGAVSYTHLDVYKRQR